MAKTSVNSYIEKSSDLGVATPEIIATATPNPVTNTGTVHYRLDKAANVQIMIADGLGKPVQMLANKHQDAGTYSIDWQSGKLARGAYYITIAKDGAVQQTIRVVKQ